MPDILKRLTRYDIALIISLFIISFLPLLINNHTPIARYAEIKVDGKIYKKIPLAYHKGKEELFIETAYGENTITIDDDTIAVTKADCPDAVCIKAGKAKNVGDTIACLPHKLIIEIKSTNNAANENELIMTR